MIREKALKGKSAYAIGNDLGVAENTAKKYMTQPEKKHGLKGRKRISKLDPYEDYINELLGQGIYNCVVLHERLEERGYDGSITILKEYVAPFRLPKKVPAVQRFETLPGKQAQMDWGIIQCIDEYGITHKAAGFIMIMGQSRAKYVEFTKRSDYYSLIRCMVNAFTYFGGIPETVLTDNMKTVILGREAGKPIWNPKFEDFAVSMGFIPKVCRPRKPQTKGKVERLVYYVKDNFLPGRVFRDMADLNRQAQEWCRKVDSKRHGTTGEIPLYALKQEPLRSLPRQEILSIYRWEPRKVTTDGFISFDGVKYGVPWEYSGREVRVRMLNDHVEVYDGEVRISDHQVEQTSGKIIWLKGQYTGLTEKHGIALPIAFARQISDKNVEQRPLSIYDEVIGVAVNG